MKDKNFFPHLGELKSEVDLVLRRIRDEKIISRIWKRDHTIWKDDPAEISNRLGWLDGPEVMKDAVPEITAYVEKLKADGFEKAVLLGMGGSSLAPEMFRAIFGVKEGFLDLAVLDSTDPGAVLDCERSLDINKTVFLVSSKSGGTVETLSFMKYFYQKAVQALGAEQAGAHFTAITDPGSGLEATATELDFRKIFINDPNIGGRYSALSYFGLVPAGIVGIDLSLLLERADWMVQNSRDLNFPDNDTNTPVILGAAFGELANRGLDKLTLIASPQIATFGAWVEQLVAESTGKDSKGVLPVEGEDVLAPAEYSRDRLFISIRLSDDHTFNNQVAALKKAGFPVIELELEDVYDIGAEIFRAEIATAVAGMVIGINPFDQPNVESAKVLARNMVNAYMERGEMAELVPTFEADGIKVYSDFEINSIPDALQKFISLASFGKDDVLGRSYFSIQAYLNPSAELSTALHELRTNIQRKFKFAVTVGYGPRFLHSTGQLHKGDTGNGMFIQLTADMPEDAPIPDSPLNKESSISFGFLKTAQARGDRQALLDAGRRVLGIHLGSDPVKAVRLLTQNLP